MTYSSLILLRLIHEIFLELPMHVVCPLWAIDLLDGNIQIVLEASVALL